MNLIQTKPKCASSSNLADMLTMVNPIDFLGHSSKVKVTMGVIDKCGCAGMLRFVLLYFGVGQYCLIMLYNKSIVAKKHVLLLVF